MKDNLRKSKRKDTGFIFGQMAESFKDGGSMENNMDQGYTLGKKKRNTNMDYGKWGKE